MMRAFSVATVALSLLGFSTPVFAQDTAETGVYGVLRAGVLADTDLRFRDTGRVDPDVFPRNVDFRPGFTGELGAGYDFGGFRLEGTVGYAQAKLNRKRAGPTFTDDGRVRALNLGVSGYVDIPVSDTVVPFIGGGIGASRVDARLERVGVASVGNSRFDDKDWGFQWHIDAGLGVKAAQNTTIEFAGRYTRTTRLDFEGSNGATPSEFSPRLSNLSFMLGLRQAF